MRPRGQNLAAQANSCGYTLMMGETTAEEYPKKLEDLPSDILAALEGNLTEGVKDVAEPGHGLAKGKKYPGIRFANGRYKARVMFSDLRIETAKTGSLVQAIRWMNSLSSLRCSGVAGGESFGSL